GADHQTGTLDGVEGASQLAQGPLVIGPRAQRGSQGGHQRADLVQLAEKHVADVRVQPLSRPATQHPRQRSPPPTHAPPRSDYPPCRYRRADSPQKEPERSLPPRSAESRPIENQAVAGRRRKPVRLPQRPPRPACPPARTTRPGVDASCRPSGHVPARAPGRHWLTRTPCPLAAPRAPPDPIPDRTSRRSAGL